MAMRGRGIELIIPLCERPASKSTTVSKLLDWRITAQQRASSISFTELDGGPDSSELLMEIEWYLDDAVESCTSGKKKISGWRQLKSAMSEASSAGPNLKNSQVFLRASLDELDQGWKQRIEQRRPFQYIVGCAHWRDFVLSVQDGVLIPRPETEQLVDLAAEAVAMKDHLKQGLWADLGTGSGAIAIGIARILDGSGSVVAVDASDVALAVSEANVRRYNLQESVTITKGSWFGPLQHKAGEFSGIISNPPYIPSRNMVKLQAEVGKHEPVSALDGGDEGTDHLVEICNGACWALKPGGFLALETDGDEQAHAIADFLMKKPFEDVKVVKDFADIDRFVTALRSSS